MAQSGELLLDARRRQAETEQVGMEHGLAVSAHPGQPAVAIDGIEQGTQEGDGRLVCKRFESDGQAVAVVDDVENRMSQILLNAGFK